MRILVIIVTYNGMSWLCHCLKSLEMSEIPLDIFIVDNGSTDGTIRYIREWGKTVEFVENKTNLGFGKANNIGLRYVKEYNYDYAYLMNQDAWIYPDTMKKLVEVHKKNPDFGILSPMQIKTDEKHFETIFGTGVCPRIWHRDITEDLYFNQMEDIYEVPDVMAAHWLVSKDCINKVGGFSPAFPHYGEDDNFINRCRYHGFKVGIVPAARAVHDADSHPADRKKKIYLTNIFMLVNLQKIYDAYRHPYYMTLRYAIRMSIKLMSMYPLWFYVKHVVNRRTYAQYRNMSKTTAFLS